jgi:hypothetical protein
MPKQQTEHLVDLIKRMNKAEKRSFRIFANRQASQEEKLFMIIFDHIDQYQDLEEAILLKKNTQIKKIQLPNIKANLYRQILTNLRLLYRKSQNDIHTREMIDFAKVLHAKGMYKASLDMLYKAKSNALNQEELALAYSALEMERGLENQYVTGSMAGKADDIELESHTLNARIRLNNDLANLSLKLYALYLRYGYVRDKRDAIFIEEYFRSHLPKYEEKELGFYDKIYLFQSYTWYYYMMQDFANNYKFSQKWVDLFETNPAMIKQNRGLYIKGLHNVLVASFMANREDKFVPNFEKLLNFEKQNHEDFTLNEYGMLELTKFIHLVNMIFITGKYTENLPLIQPIEAKLQENKNDWDVNRRLAFQYKIACVHFGAGNHSRSIDYLNDIINSPIYDLRNDIQCFARFLNLIAHYELGNQLLISYQIKSVYRFLAKMEELQQVQKEIFNFLRRMPSIQNQYLKGEFIDLRKKLVKYQQDPYERRAFLYLDIIAWLDSKIEGIPIEQVIQAKIKKSNQNE